MGKDKHTPMRAFRVPDDVWQDALAEARERGVPLSDLMRDYLRRLGAPQRKKRERDGDPST